MKPNTPITSISQVDYNTKYDVKFITDTDFHTKGELFIGCTVNLKTPKGIELTDIDVDDISDEIADVKEDNIICITEKDFELNHVIMTVSVLQPAY